MPCLIRRNNCSRITLTGSWVPSSIHSVVESNSIVHVPFSSDSSDGGAGRYWFWDLLQPNCQELWQSKVERSLKIMKGKKELILFWVFIRS